MAEGKPIVLINVRDTADSILPPLGCMYISHSLKQAGYAVNVLHFTEKELDENVEKTLKLDPLYVGISVITGNKTRHSAEFSRKIKAKSSIPVVWGGIHPSLLPFQCIKEDYIDYVIVGEGEETSVDLANALENKMQIKDVSGLVYKDVTKKPRFNKPRPLMEDLDKVKIDWDCIDITKCYEQQWESKRILSYVSSRGCAFDCAFCYNNIFNQKRWRAHSFQRVIDDVTYMKEQFNCDGIRFFDDFLFVNQKRAIDIVEKIKLPWFAEIRVNSINERVVQKLIETDARELLFGMESGSERILNLMNKKQGPQDIIQCVKYLTKFKELRALGTFILGSPTETQKETFETVDLIVKLKEIHPNMRYAVGVYLPYPGSEMYTMALQMGFKPPQRTEDWDFLDRSNEKLKLDWIDWNKDASYFIRIREYIHLLALSNYNIPYISDLPKKRLKQKDFSHPLELKMLTALQKKFAMQGSLVRKIGYRVLPMLKKEYRPELVVPNSGEYI